MLSFWPQTQKQLSSGRLLGLALIVIGLALVRTFAWPYVYYAAAPRPADIPLDRAVDRLIIPDIKLVAPLYNDMGRLDHGLVFAGDINLGRGTNTVVEGHNIAKDGPLFSLLHLIRPGSLITVDWRGKRYMYKVARKTVVSPDEKARLTGPGQEESLTLISCYPPTSTAMRLVVTARPVRSAK